MLEQESFIFCSLVSVEPQKSPNALCEQNKNIFFNIEKYKTWNSSWKAAGRGKGRLANRLSFISSQRPRFYREKVHQNSNEIGRSLCFYVAQIPLRLDGGSPAETFVDVRKYYFAPKVQCMVVIADCIYIDTYYLRSSAYTYLFFYNPMNRERLTRTRYGRRCWY